MARHRKVPEQPALFGAGTRVPHDADVEAAIRNAIDRARQQGKTIRAQGWGIHFVSGVARFNDLPCCCPMAAVAVLLAVNFDKRHSIRAGIADALRVSDRWVDGFIEAFDFCRNPKAENVHAEYARGHALGLKMRREYAPPTPAAASIGP